MAQPVLGSLAQRLYDQLQPLAYADEANGWALAIFLGALGDTLFQEIEDYADDTDTAVGWSVMVDIDNAPDKALPWLAQLVGVNLKSGLTAVDQRQQIRDLANWKRGTVQAMHDSPKPYLTGGQTVVFRERYDEANPGVDAPYHLTVITYTPETPDPIAVLGAILEQKPAGLVLHYQVNAGQDYQSLRTNYASYSAVNAAYSSYNGVLIDQPGT